MARIILLSVFIILSLNPTLATDYTKYYHPYINKAELAIVDGHYEMALGIYAVTFEKVPSAFARDYFNAAVCAVKLNRYQQALIYCDSLIAKGVTKGFLENEKALSTLRSFPYWSSYINTYNQKRKKIFIKAKYNDILMQLVRLEEADQVFRKMEGSYEKYGDTISAIDTRNMDTLLMIWDKYGFPGEGLVGTASPREVLPHPWIVLWHHCQLTATKGKENLTNRLKQAVRNGHMYPVAFGRLMCAVNDNNYNLMSCGVVVLRFEDNVSPPLAEQVSEEQAIAINKKRISAGLESLNDFYRKAAFVLNGGVARDFAFPVYDNITAIDLPTQKHFDKMQEFVFKDINEYL
mgnify:CR=1 FL=1